MTDETSDREPVHKSPTSDRTGVGKTTKIGQSSREMYESADFDGTFAEWIRERSFKPSEGDTDWIDPKAAPEDIDVDEEGERR